MSSLQHNETSQLIKWAMKILKVVKGAVSDLISISDELSVLSRHRYGDRVIGPEEARILPDEALVLENGIHVDI